MAGAEVATAEAEGASFGKPLQCRQVDKKPAYEQVRLRGFLAFIFMIVTKPWRWKR
jgi:hypothetical protein